MGLLEEAKKILLNITDMENLIQHFIKAFGWSIINSLWQSALIYGALFIVLFSLPKLAARYRHNLAFGSIILMFVFFAYNFISHMVNGLSKQATVNAIQNIQAYSYFNNIPPSFSSKAEHYFPLVVAFYILGIILQLFVIVKGYTQLSKLKKERLSFIPYEWKPIFDRVTKHLKIKKTVKFRLSDMINVPVVIGYLKPIVLFPIALVNQLDNDQVESILIHELSHIRRNDFLLNLIKTAIETLLFFNPFVWMAGRFIHIEREHACDDLVLKITGKPLNYAHALLKLELLKEKNSPAYALAATGKTQNLYQRIKRITNMKTNYLNAKQQMAALTLGIACLFSIAWINPAEKKKAEQKIKKESITSLIKVEPCLKPIIYLDTTKKRKIKIVTIDANGVKTEYNSVKEMPDSIKRDFYKDNASFRANALMLNLDSNNFHFKFDTAAFASIKNLKIDTAFQSLARIEYMNSKNMPDLKIQLDQMKKHMNTAEWKKQQAEMNKRFNSPEARAKWQKYGETMARVYSSPETKAKLKKYSEEVAKAYTSPEAQAKWKKFGEDVAKEYSSPEAQAKWKKFGEDVAKEYGSPEAQARYKKISDDVIKITNSPTFKAEIDRVRIRGNNDSLFIIDGKRMSSVGGSLFYSTDNTSRKLKESDEYKKIKEKFDREVKELKEKMERKERAEKKEKAN